MKTGLLVVGLLVGTTSWGVWGVAHAQNESSKYQAVLNKPAATVNHEFITKAQVEALVRQLNGGVPDSISVPEKRRKESRHMATAMLIDDAIWRQAMSKQLPQPTQNDITKRLVDLEESLKKQNKTLQQFCTESSQSMEQVQTAIIGVLQWIEYVRTKITDADLQKYHAEYKDLFDGNLVHISHIIVPVSPKATEADRQASWTKINNIRQEILTGKIDFESAARKYSQCNTAKEGGKIGWIERKWGNIHEAIAKAAFDPTVKPGNITNAVASDSGFHIIKVDDRKQGPGSTFEMDKEKVREIYQEEVRQALISQYRASSKVEVHHEVIEVLP